MGTIDRIIAEASTLDETQQARLLAFVEQLKAERMRARGITLTAEQARARDALARALASFRLPLAAYRFDREEANAR
jgi:hypothetical protein